MSLKILTILLLLLTLTIFTSKAGHIYVEDP